MTVLAPKAWTDKELLALPNDGIKREIIDGELVMSPASSVHGAIIMRIAGPLFMFVSNAGLGEVLDGQIGCRLKDGDLVSPDISFVSTLRWKGHRQTADVFFGGGPDFLVEVLSPDDTVGKIEGMLEKCFAQGTRLAWIVHPRTRRVHVYRATGPDIILKDGQVLDGDDVIPGFTLKISGIFPE